MSIYHLEYLTRDSYIGSIQTIKDPKTLAFADMSLKWWDKKFGWYMKGCVVLCNNDNRHLCYIFFKIDKYNEYITIHNIFTPLLMRRNGFANILLGMIFDLAISKKVSRFRLTSISKSLDFYLALGFIYWGVNSVGDYYCDLPMPNDGLIGVEYMVQNTEISVLIGKNFKKILAKVQNNNNNLTVAKKLIYKSDLIKLGDSYLLSSLLEEKKFI